MEMWNTTTVVPERWLVRSFLVTKKGMVMGRMQGTDTMEEGSSTAEEQDMRTVGGKRRKAGKDMPRDIWKVGRGQMMGHMQHIGLKMDTKVLESDDQLELFSGLLC